MNVLFKVVDITDVVLEFLIAVIFIRFIMNKKQLLSITQKIICSIGLVVVHILVKSATKAIFTMILGISENLWGDDIWYYIEYVYISDFTMLALVKVFEIMMEKALIKHRNKITKERSREEFLKQQLKSEAEYYKELSQRQQITNKTMHDLKNQMFALREICSDNPDEGLNKINTICEAILTSYTLKFTGTESVDALITSKIIVMEEKNINFFNSIYISGEIGVDITDMCILLGNLLDNAIEANDNDGIKERFIRLNMLQQMNYLSISISNPTAKATEIIENTIDTTKDNKEQHGFGLKSVKDIVNKYDGSCTFKQNNNVFEVVLMLKNK